MRLQNKIALITGATSGIGKQITQNFLDEGAKVIACGRRESLGFTADNLAYCRGDVTNFSDAQKIVDYAIAQFGKLDILVNSAGITMEGNLETTSSEDFMKQYETNVLGVFNICKAAILELKKQKNASIINIASELGVKPILDRVAYCPSKAAVLMLTKNIAVDYAPHIRANNILPGLTDTPMIEERFKSSEDPKALRKLYESFYLLKRLGTTHDIAHAAVFLASDDSSFITGADIPVCGGGQII